MKNKSLEKIFLLIFSAMPFGFFAIYGDGVLGTMGLYGLLVVGLGVFTWATIKIEAIFLAFLGTGLGCLSSLVALKLSQLGDMGDYFKPFTSRSLILVIYGAVAVIQALWVLNFREKEDPAIDLDTGKDG